MNDNVIKEISCPECERVWPTISEQGIVAELYGRCYRCLIAGVVKVRDERQKAVDYVVQNCSICGGLPPNVLKCIPCGNKGWETVDKAQEASAPKIVYPH